MFNMEISTGSSSSGIFESSTPYIVRKVEFINVQDHYSYDQDLICKYVLIDHVSQEHDRVAIYRIGWSQVKEYVLFEWAPLSKGETQTVIFHRPSLPKTTPELMYHFCYIGADNEVLGASAPFQFCEDLPDPRCISMISLPDISASIMAQQNAADANALREKDKEIAKLRDENAVLLGTLKMMVQNSKNEDGVKKEVAELKNMVKLLQKSLHLQEREIGDLKRKLSEQDRMRNTEKLNNFNIHDVGELETLPPFPKCL